MKKGANSLLGELKRFAKAAEDGDFSFTFNADNLSGEEAEAIRLLKQAVGKYRSAFENDIMNYKLTSEAMRIALWEMDVVADDPVNPNNKFIWSSEFRHMLGFTDENDFPNVLESWINRLHPDDKEKSVNAFAAHMNDYTGKTPYEIEYRLMHKSGEYRYYDGYGAALRNSKGVPLKVSGAIRDITERSRIKEQLIDNNLRLNLLLKSQNIAMWDMTVDLNNPVGAGNAFWWSPELRHMLGFSDERDFPNVLSSWSDRFHPEDKERTLSAFAAHINDRTGKTPYDVEFRLMLKNGEYRHFHAFGETLRDSAGVPIRVAGGLKDINEQKMMKAALVRREELLETLNTMSVAFLSQGNIKFDDIMTKEVGVIIGLMNLDRLSVWRNFKEDNGLRASMIYCWDKESGGVMPPAGNFDDIPYTEFMPSWERIFSDGGTINGPARLMPEREAASLKAFGCVSAFVSPVFINSAFWGFVLFEDRQVERYFDNESAEMMRSAAFLFASAVMRDEMERELAKANNLTKLMLDSSPLNCEIWDDNLNMLDCNEASIRFLGLESKKDYMGRFYDFSPEFQPDGQRSDEKLEMTQKKAFEEGRYVFEWQHILADGTLVPAEVTLVAIKYGDDNAVIAYTRDLREHRMMMNEINRRTNELSIQRNTLQTMINSMPDFVFGKNLNFEYTLLNFSAAKYLNVDVDNVIGKNDIEGLKFSTEVAEIMTSQDKRIFDGEQKFVDEHWIPAHDGSLRYFETTKAPIIQDGAIIGLVGVSRDITENTQMKKELEAALEQATIASKAKGDFLSTMSHEMRTPMNAIIGMTAIGKRADNLEEKNYALNKIEDASSHLLGVINDVLDMAKIEANKLQLSPVEYNFDKMLQKLSTVVKFRAEEKQQKLTVSVDKGIPHFIVGDDQRLAQIMTNLLSNAVKFTPEHGDIRLEASLVGETDGICELCFKVSDSGIGISPEQQEKLFNAFEQAQSGTSREYGGTGLGLVISKSIVELMGGRIWVESELGKGASFIFTVKARRGEKSSSSLLAPAVNWGNVRILAVDDMPGTRMQFQDLFSQLNIKCDVAGDGLEACRIIEERGEYDIYFIDWRMPGMDGFELTRYIKSRGQTRPPVITMITGADWEVVKDEALAAGVDKHLLKPLFSSMIIDCVNECLGTSPDLCEDIGSTGGEFAGKRILLAEDMEINREIFMGVLEGTGIIIDCAENGKEALDMVESAPEKYDIVFMDVQMPKMDGLEASRQIRALPAHRRDKLPIIALTANVFKDEIEACFAAGMDDHLGKPLYIDMVFEKLRKYL